VLPLPALAPDPPPEPDAPPAPAPPPCANDAAVSAKTLSAIVPACNNVRNSKVRCIVTSWFARSTSRKDGRALLVPFERGGIILAKAAAAPQRCCYRWHTGANDITELAWPRSPLASLAGEGEANDAIDAHPAPCPPSRASRVRSIRCLAPAPKSRQAGRVLRRRSRPASTGPQGGCIPPANSGD
jgi:hypothetical protein